MARFVYRNQLVLLVVTVILLVIMAAWPRSVEQSSHPDFRACANCGGTYYVTTRSYGLPYTWLVVTRIDRKYQPNGEIVDTGVDPPQIVAQKLLYNIIIWAVGVSVAELYLLLRNKGSRANTRH